MYVVKYNGDNEIVSWQLVTQEYLDTYKGDKSNPATDKTVKVLTPEEFKSAKKYVASVKTEKERALETLGLTQRDLDNIKKLQ